MLLRSHSAAPVSQRLWFWRRRSVCSICRNHAANRNTMIGGRRLAKRVQASVETSAN